MTAENKASSIVSGFDSAAHLNRFLIAVCASIGAFTIAAIMVVQFADLKFSGGGIEVNVAGQEIEHAALKSISLEDSGFQMETSEGNRLASVLLPTNQLWLNTKIKIRPGDIIKLRASGSANLAEQLNLAAINNPKSYEKVGFNFLVDPYGRRLNWLARPANKLRNRNADELRNAIKLKPGYPLGILIGVVMPNGNFVENNPRPNDTFAITDDENQRGFVYRGENEGFLFLAVNDIIGLPDEASKISFMMQVAPDNQPLSLKEQDRQLCDAFPLDICDAKSRAVRRKDMNDRWEQMRAGRRWEAFYEDNSGNYMVTISIHSTGS
jgi:hypothetical protein